MYPTYSRFCSGSTSCPWLPAWLDFCIQIHKTRAIFTCTSHSHQELSNIQTTQLTEEWMGLPPTGVLHGLVLCDGGGIVIPSLCMELVESKNKSWANNERINDLLFNRSSPQCKMCEGGGWVTWKRILLHFILQIFDEWEKIFDIESLKLAFILNGTRVLFDKYWINNEIHKYAIKTGVMKIFGVGVCRAKLTDSYATWFLPDNAIKFNSLIKMNMAIFNFNLLIKNPANLIFTTILDANWEETEVKDFSIASKCKWLVE